MTTEPIMNQTALIFLFHNGLGPKHAAYREVYSQNHQPFTPEGKPTYDLTYAMDRFANQAAESQGGQDPSAESTTALAAVTAGPNSRVVAIKHCTHCNKDYHTCDECHVSHPELKRKREETTTQQGGNGNQNSQRGNRGKRGRREGRGGNSGNGGNRQQSGSLSNQTGFTDNSNNNNTAYVANNNNELVTDTFLAFAATSAGEAPVSTTKAGATLGPKMWALDTGCSQHVICDKNAFITYKAFANPRPVNGLAGAIQALGSGTITIPCEVDGRCELISFLNAIYVPEAPLNLLSLGQMDGKCPNKMVPGVVQIGYSSITAIKRSNNLYTLSIWSTPRPTTSTSSSIPVFSAVNQETLIEWHARLGHLGEQKCQETGIYVYGQGPSQAYQQQGTLWTVRNVYHAFGATQGPKFNRVDSPTTLFKVTSLAL